MNDSIYRLFARACILAAALLSLPLSASVYETEDPVDFSLPQLHGETVALSDYLGEWVVLNYWATWCAPCRKEIPELSELHKERADVTVLGIAYEDIDLAAFDFFLEEFYVSYPILLADVYQPPQPFGAPRVLPTTIILDPAGRSVKAFLGPVTRHDIENYINAQPQSESQPAGVLRLIE